jgi:rod shape-determining protein MreB
MNARAIFRLFSNDLAIDLGSSNTLVFARGEGIVVSEPSIVAVNNQTGRVEAVGRAAKDMLGRTPANIVAVRPVKNGVIADFEAAERMLSYFIKKAHRRSYGVRPRIVLCVPCETTQVEKRAVRDAAYRAHASEVHLVENAMAAAFGAELPVTEAAGNMVVDVGGGTTDVAVLSLGGVVFSRTIRVAGDAMEQSIATYVRKKYGLLVGERTAETIKINLGSAFPLDEELVMEIKGRDLVAGVPKTLRISDEEIRQALTDPVGAIVDLVRLALESTPPELASDIVDRGIVLTGGGALLKNLDRRIREETGLPVIMADNPLATVVLGSGKLLSRFDLLKRIALA